MATRGRGYGLNPDVNPNNPTYAFIVQRDLQPIVDLRKDMPPIYDQGMLGSCTANALGAAFEYNQMKNLVPYTCMPKNPPTVFMPSRLFIYYNERVLGGNVMYDTGAALEDGVMSLYNHGVCPETVWAYNTDKFINKPPKTAYWKAKKTRVRNYKKIPKELAQLRASLSEGYPISFGMQIFESFESDTVAKHGMVPYPAPFEECYGGHAVLLVGYNDNLKLFIVRNSWGDDWGDDGYFFMPYEYVLSSYCRDFWVLVNVESD
jgi:C1A family cysteine protease